MSEPVPPDGMSLEQQLAYARDLRRVYDAERARRRELETANQALAVANAELDRRLYDILAAQDWILAVNSSRELPALIEALTQPLVVLLHAADVVVFPWMPDGEQLGPALGHAIRVETPELAALRTSALSAAVLDNGAPWEVPDLAAPPAGDQDTRDERLALAAEEYAVARALGWGALVAWPLVARGQRVGLLYVAWETPHVPDERERTLLELLAQHAAVSLLNAQVLAESSVRAEALRRAEQQQLAYARDLRRAYDAERARRAEVQEAYLATVEVLAAAIETRDPHTGSHVEQTARYAVAIGEELGWEGDRLLALELGALLHDVGKIGVDDHLLRKPGPLEPDEWEQMRRHPDMGHRLLEPVLFLKKSLTCVRHHQERYDGSGYPDGLARERIPLEARVVAVAESFDAMISDHPYRAARPVAEALAELERCAGSQFDPAIVAAFLRVVQKGAIDEPGGESAQLQPGQRTR
jgi:HD-GYP domain-containing protein (c-di-GMP phosphodiesterase class II)